MTINLHVLEDSEMKGVSFTSFSFTSLAKFAFAFDSVVLSLPTNESCFPSVYLAA